MRTSIAAWAIVCLPSIAIANDPLAADIDRIGAPHFVVPGVDQRLDPLPLREVAVHADVSGVVANVTVTQLWENTGATPIDATYVFPLSTRAAVHALEMRVGGRRIVATIKEKEVARADFEEARRVGQRAALLEQRRPNMFTTEVANIQPGDVVEVELAYVELLRPTDGVYSLVIPRVVGPRYVSPTEAFPDVPWSVMASPDDPAEPTLHAWPVSVSLAGGVPIQWAGSSTHPVTTDDTGGDLEIELADATPDTTRDFVLDYALGGDALAAGVLVEPDADGDGGHFLALVEPPERIEPALVPARDYVFIVDTSGSMEGWPLAAAKTLVGKLVDGLDAKDRVNILAFSGGNERLAPASLPATAANKARARAFIGARESSGGTELLGALTDALDTPPTPGLARTFVLVTDGYVTVEAQAIDLVRQRAGDATVFAVGIGDGVNRHLIEVVAHAGQGEAYVAQTEAEASELVERVFEDARAPILTDVAFRFEGLDAYDVEPRAVPTLYASRPLLVTGRYRGEAGGALIVTGRSGRGQWFAQTPIPAGAAAERHPAVPLLWARERIARLSDFAGAYDAPDHEAEVTGLGLAYHLVTAHTSFVVVDDGKDVAQPSAPAIDSFAAMSGAGMAMGGGSGGLGFTGSGAGGSGTGYGRIGVVSGMGQIDTGGGQGTAESKPSVSLALAVSSAPSGAKVPTDVVAALKRRLGALRRCLQASAETLAQTLAWEILLGLDGALVRSTLVSGTLDDAASACVDRNFRRIRFASASVPRTFRVELSVR